MVNRIVIAETDGNYKILGDVKKCKICNINFSAMQPCIMCKLRINKEKEVGRPLSKKEFEDLYEWIR